MSKSKKTEGIKEIEKALNDINTQIDEWTKHLDPLGETGLDLNNMEKAINDLKGHVPTKKSNEETIDTTPPPIDGETCMHGNSWHSNCMECDSLDDYEIALNEMENIINTEPNDKELGRKIRDFYHKWIEFNDNKVNTTVD